LEKIVLLELRLLPVRHPLLPHHAHLLLLALALPLQIHPPSSELFLGPISPPLLLIHFLIHCYRGLFLLGEKKTPIAFQIHHLPLLCIHH
jgi:hypothetical protein